MLVPIQSIKQPGLFRNVDSKLKLVSEIVSEEKNSEPSGAHENEHNEELLKLKGIYGRRKAFSELFTDDSGCFP